MATHCWDAGYCFSALLTHSGRESVVSDCPNSECLWLASGSSEEGQLLQPYLLLFAEQGGVKDGYVRLTPPSPFASPFPPYRALLGPRVKPGGRTKDTTCGHKLSLFRCPQARHTVWKQISKVLQSAGDTVANMRSHR